MTRGRTLLVVWGSMVVSILLYAAVAASVLRTGAKTGPHGVDLWLEVEAAGAAWAAIVLWKTRRIGRAAIRRVSVVCWALSESIAILGLVLTAAAKAF